MNIIDNNNLAFRRIISPGSEIAAKQIRDWKITNEVRSLILMQKYGVTQQDVQDF